MLREVRVNCYFANKQQDESLINARSNIFHRMVVPHCLKIMHRYSCYPYLPVRSAYQHLSCTRPSPLPPVHRDPVCIKGDPIPSQVRRIADKSCATRDRLSGSFCLSFSRAPSKRTGGREKGCRNQGPRARLLRPCSRSLSRLFTFHSTGARRFFFHPPVYK